MYDLICIGAGSGGIGLSTSMNRFGFKVLLIDKRDETIGGDCLNFGCVPSKAIIHTAKVVKHARDAKRFGIESSGRADMRVVKEYIKGKQNVIRVHENASYYRKIGIDVALGEAKFASENSVEVSGETYRGKKIVICTGSSPRLPQFPGLEQIKHFYTNETIFGIEELPEKMIVIGGGPIGMELGQAFQHLGSQVTFLLRSNRFLPKEDAEIATVLRNQMIRDGVELLFEHTPKESPSPNELIVETKDGQTKTLQFDALLSAIGRELHTDTLGLDRAGIATNERGKLVLTDTLQTTNPRVFACGDIAGGLQFTHMAEVHVRLLLNNFFSPFKKKLSLDTFPWVTFTSPEIATWGMGEQTLKEKGLKYDVVTHDFTDDDRAIVDENTAGKLKLFISKDTIVGGTMVAENAGEIAQELMLMTAARLPLKHIFSKIYPYPTAARVNQAAIMDRFVSRTAKYKSLLKLLYR